MSVLSLRAKTAIAVMHRISTKPHPSCALYSTLNKLLVNKLLQESSKGQNALIGVPTPESIMSSPDFNSPLAIRSFFHLTGLNTGKPVESQVINDDAHLSNLSSKSQPSGHPGTGGIGNPQRDYDQQISDKAEQHGIESALHKLNLNVQRTGRAYLDHVLSIFAGIKRCGGCTPNEALLLLRCCGNFLTDEKVEIRAALSEELWAYYQNKGIELDTSHYNALLKNRLDNEGPEFQPTEFLATMEANDVEANRVTFQHLIAKFCSLGDIHGATTILEHMKEQKMSVNENVFHSLIIGHCRADDFLNAKGVMTIMVDSNVDVGSDTRMIYVLELARAGKDFKEEIDNIVAEGIQITDNDFFKLIVTLLEKGDVTEASNIAEMLPKKRGFFQEMRNVIPAMVSKGGVELSFKILEDFKVPAPLGSEGHEDANMADHSNFFLAAMIRNEYDPKRVINYAKKFKGAEDIVSTRILEFCVDHGQIAYGQAVFDEIIKEFGEDTLNPTLISTYVRMRSNYLKKQSFDKESTVEAFIQFLINMEMIGLRPLTSDLSQSIIPNIFACDELPGHVLRRINDKRNALLDAGIQPRNRIPYSQQSNAVLQSLLNEENILSFGRAVDFFLYTNVPARPHLWNSSLARSFLATNNKEFLVTILSFSSSKLTDNQTKRLLEQNNVTKEHLEKRDEDLFQVLNHIVALLPRYRPDTSPEDILCPVLEDLSELNIGIPEMVTSLLSRSLEGCSEKTLKLINQLEHVYSNNQSFMTDEKFEEFHQRQKSTVNLAIASVRANFVPMAASGYIKKEDMPTSLTGLERIQNVIDRKGKFNSTITNKLIRAYVENNKLSEADDRIQLSLNHKYEIVKLINPTIRAYVDACIRIKQFDRASKLFAMLQKNYGTGYKIWISNYIELALAMAKEGHHEKVLDLFKEINIETLESRYPLHHEGSLIVNYYASNGDMYNGKKILEVLQNSKIVDNTYKLAPPNLSSETLEEKLDLFENTAKKEQRIGHIFPLLKLLIEKEDLERIQRVLNTSIDVIGETKSLYNLAFAFIDSGKFSQAKKLLATPGLRYDKKKVDYLMDILSKEGKIDKFEKFVQFSRPVFSCDREHMYTRFISECAKRKEAERIQEAWVNMQEEDFVPSDHLKVQIATALQANGLSVPFSIPQITEKTPEIVKNVSTIN